MKYKKKLNVIRPTLRHKTIYFKLKFTKSFDDEKKLKNIVFKNFEKTNGLFSQINTNLSIFSINLKESILIIRINSNYKDEFLSSLFFLSNYLGLIYILKEARTIKSLKI